MDWKSLLHKDIDIKRPGGGKYPTKQTINLLDDGEGTARNRHLVLFVIIFAILAVLFAKFMIVDQLNKLSDAESKYQQQESLLQELKSSNAGYDKAQGQYSRYSFGYMTDEELSLHDRENMLNTINTVLGGSASIESIAIATDNSDGYSSGSSSSSSSSSDGTGNGNTALVRIQCASMREASALVTRLNGRKNVAGASASQVDKGTDYETNNGKVSTSGRVVADLTIRFRSPMGDTGSSKKKDGESVSGQLADQTQRFNEAEEQGADE